MEIASIESRLQAEFKDRFIDESLELFTTEYQHTDTEGNFHEYVTTVVLQDGRYIVDVLVVPCVDEDAIRARIEEYLDMRDLEMEMDQVSDALAKQTGMPAETLAHEAVHAALDYVAEHDEFGLLWDDGRLSDGALAAAQAAA